MSKNFQIPPSFSLIEKGKVSLLLKEEYKNLLLEQGIEDINTYLKKTYQISRYLKGRAPHPVIPLGNGKNMVFLLSGLFLNLGSPFRYGSNSIFSSNWNMPLP